MPAGTGTVVGLFAGMLAAGLEPERPLVRPNPVARMAAGIGRLGLRDRLSSHRSESLLIVGVKAVVREPNGFGCRGCGLIFGA